MMSEQVEQADELSDEDEKILDKIWLEVLREEEQQDTWGKNKPQRRD
jgi:hypothetical protein